jgi:hypothetical protein
MDVENGASAPTSPCEATERSDDVKYVLLIFQNPGALDALPEDERAAVMKEFDAFNQEIEASGEFIGGSALAHADTAKTVRGRDGVAVTTDGPFAEAKEQLAGYYVVDVASPERAVEIAQGDPASRLWAIEVRAIMDSAGAEM